ncbi:MAG: tRNA pseudouridine(55) synthase TruB [Armatimonadota bacterium]|nr:tRNA pseudouridine(55) synthase TruB [Armatimonadota bacterium]MDR7438411.1 tRNA pseudouridine(55) synthase TruB [Armatimonadota bacterium]MDR7562210.1 tRNA pseudouridine(55) synthase TruB [Armatimonadota bacterium]MDR7567190.1 tRNA pseudouridine(55) synthase TruB [Armatimonadota bacterium]MDR7601255.1 tRNA pseudouridine(55) synthase TruB [Armatimonadota bacterium]
MDGLLNLLKPPGMTSHDCVEELRRLVRMRRIGHTGTLDPGAAGVLVCCIGRTTRLSEFLMEQDKAYRVELVLGVSTTTGDALGEVLARREVSVHQEDLERVLQRFVGTIQQLPPMVSAVHHEGRRLYELAREGIEVERTPRTVTVHEIRLLRFDPPRALLDITCSKGTYVRQLAHDIGEALGCGAHAGFMIRTRVGPHRLEESHTFEEIEEAVRIGEFPRLLIPPAQALPELPEVEVEGRMRAAVLHGQPLPLWKVAPHLSLPQGALVKVLDVEGNLLAIGRAVGGQLRPYKVLLVASGR